MGNTHITSSSISGRSGGGGGMLFLLQRTWTVIVSERWSRRRQRRPSTAVSSEYYQDPEGYSQYSQYSSCSCSRCQRDRDGWTSDCDSSLFETISTMAPNSEESIRIGHYPFMDETVNKEKQRPPVYNPEDYALSLRKWGGRGKGGGSGSLVALYTSNTNSDTDCTRSQVGGSGRDYRNPMMMSTGSEMTLRQFGTVSELLGKLKADLKLAFPSFVQEFAGDHLDGVTLLLDILRAIQLSQSSGHATCSTPGGNGAGKLPPSLQRRALLDELSCLECLISCCTRYQDSVQKVTTSSSGLFTLAVCIMSNVNKARIAALQLLTKVCECDPSGHSAVSEALSTLRLRFGEPVRFRFLVGMLTSTGGQSELVACGLRFLNTFIVTASSLQKRLYIQAELEQAGFDIDIIKKNISIKSPAAESIFGEIDKWEKNFVDVETLTIRLRSTEQENDTLKDKLLLLERRIQILQEEKGVLLSLEQCLKDRCSELQDEVHSLQSGKSTLIYDKNTNKDKGSSNAADDEGISSSERSLTPEELQRGSSIYEVYGGTGDNIKSKTEIAVKSPNDTATEDEEETTIEEVMEELRNIINDVESENYKQEEQRKQISRKLIEEAQVAGKIQMRLIDMDDFAIDHENQIVPSNLHPHPPRKSRSLIHLFIPAEDYNYNNREMFFENETAFTSDESSDSLLSSAKLRIPIEKGIQNNNKLITDSRQKIDKGSGVKNRIKRNNSKASVNRSDSFRYLAKSEERFPQVDPNDMYYYNTSILINTQTNSHQISEEVTKVKSKSLEKLDDGLESMVDVVLTDNEAGQNDLSIFDSRDMSLSRSISNVLITSRRDFNSRLSNNSEDKQKMFLPLRNEKAEIPYYFPRLQERKGPANNFLIKRGHGNAGMYSGQALRDKSFISLNINNEFMANSSCTSNGRLTDLPSGLY